jgi:hypothetical protein
VLDYQHIRLGIFIYQCLLVSLFLICGTGIALIVTNSFGIEVKGLSEMQSVFAHKATGLNETLRVMDLNKLVLQAMEESD